MAERSFVRNAADSEQVEEAEQKVESLNDQKLNDLREVLSTRRGRRFYWRYLEICGIFRTSNADEHQVFFNEGMRNIGLQLLADLNEAAPEVYPIMLQEAKEK